VRAERWSEIEPHYREAVARKSRYPVSSHHACRSGSRRSPHSRTALPMQASTTRKSTGKSGLGRLNSRCWRGRASFRQRCALRVRPPALLNRPASGPGSHGRV
jgi:hypothetical protein